MSEKPQKLTHKQEQAIACLLTTRTVSEAAEACGVGEATMFRWLRIEQFDMRYRRARKAILDGALGDLQVSTREAVETLKRLLDCGKPSVEVRAAMAIIDLGIRVGELGDLAERIRHLEMVNRVNRGGR